MAVKGQRTAMLGVIALAAAFLTAAPATAAEPTAGGKAAVAAPGFVSVGPTRLLDTRTDPVVHALGQGQSISVKVTGVAHVPATGVDTVVLNLTGIATTHSAYLTVYPTGGSRPLASNLNLSQGRPRANQVFARVGANGSVDVFNSTGSTNVLVDIAGYFVTGSSFTGRSPQRVLDTRAVGGAALPRAATRTVHLAGTGSIPSTGVSAVVVNITGISLRGSTYVTAYPAASARPTTSNLNLSPGQTGAVLAVVQLDANGNAAFYNSGGPTHLVLDVTGWFIGTADYTPVAPSRLLDSRLIGSLSYGGDGPLQVAGSAAIPASAGAAVLSVTVIRPLHRGFVAVRPDGSVPSGTSSVNVEADQVTSNLVVVQLSTGGAVSIYDAAYGAFVVVDVVGWLDTNQAVSFPAPLPGAGEVTQPYALSLTPQAGLAPYAWAVTGGSLPAGLTLDSSSGQITGTPTESGTAQSAVEVVDSSGGRFSRKLTVVVYPFVSSALWGWGGNNAGYDLPTHSIITPTPIQLGASGPASAVTPGNLAAYAIHADGTLWAWGEHHLVGEGLGTDTPATAPVQVTGLSGVVQVATALTDTYALTSSGTVWAWGAGGGGGLGNGTTTDSWVPVQVPSLSGVTAIGASSRSGFALLGDGTVRAWGQILPNVIGNGGATTSSVPLQVDGLPLVSSLGLGAQDGYAVASDGTVWGWGQGQAGQLGTATSVTSRAPVQVVGLTHVTQVRAGSGTGYALTDAGKVLAWGQGGAGQLGTGVLADNAVPTEVPGLTGVTQLAASSQDGFALTADGSLWSWGSYQSGIHGDGVGFPFLPASSPPTRVLLPGVTAVAAAPWSATAFAIGRP